jgi:2-oxoisovalerate dehydrogenase E1 component
MPSSETAKKKNTDIQTFLRAYELMCTAKEMADIFEANKEVTSKYVHATSRGHEAIQLAAAFQLKPQDFVYPYYRDDSILLGIGFTPFDCMLQLMAKRSDPFSGGRTYYSHPSARRDDMPKIPHQSSATGMQVIPATGAAQGIKYREGQGIDDPAKGEEPIVICSVGDGAITEGEVAEAFQMSVLHQYPIIYLVQDNEWDISAHASEIRAMDAPEYAKGFKGLKVYSIGVTDFEESYSTMNKAVQEVRKNRKPVMVHAKVPLLNHHTSGVRKEWYRPEEDMDSHIERDPLPRFRERLLELGVEPEELETIEERARAIVVEDYERAGKEEDPKPEDLTEHIFAPSPITEEKGERKPAGKEPVVMVDAALHAVDEILKTHPEALLYGQDVGGKLGGVFREAATLTGKYGAKRVFNTPIQEAYIIGSTCGMSAADCKPIVEVQFADYVWPGLNQLFTELSRSYYLSNGKWPVQSLIRVPIGAYGSGGPYHSSSVESVLLQIKGIKVVYPSNSADMKGLLKAAFYDPNPVVILEHKGLYWSKVPGTKMAKTVEPDEDYVIPLGKARIMQEASEEATENGESLLVVTYGMGVYWAMNASESFKDKVEILDLRSLNPLDTEMIYDRAKQHGKVLVLTEETIDNSFAESLAGRISRNCFEHLDGPVEIMGAINTPAIPLNSTLEQTMLPSAEKVREVLERLISY